MPIYDYICQGCGHIVEVMHSVNEPGPARCQRCGGEMRKLLSTPAIVFKGSGWAKKDRSSKPAGKAKQPTDHTIKASTPTDGQPAQSTTNKADSTSDA